LERCKTILSRSNPICFLFADSYVPLIMRGCIGAPLFHLSCLQIAQDKENLGLIFSAINPASRSFPRLIASPLGFGCHLIAQCGLRTKQRQRRQCFSVLIHACAESETA
jgi:hypothetical protein